MAVSVAEAGEAGVISDYWAAGGLRFPGGDGAMGERDAFEGRIEPPE